MRHLTPYTVVYAFPDDTTRRGFNCRAEDVEDASCQFERSFPNAEILWVNEGFNNFSQE